MDAYVKTLYKSDGKHIKVDLCLANGQIKRVPVDTLRVAVGDGKINLLNAYITQKNHVKHKAYTKQYMIRTLTSGFDLNKYKNSKVYDGNTKKFGVTINNKNYIVKYPKRQGDMSTVCEHVASTFINNLGYSAHKTKLFVHEGQTVVLMLDFTDKDKFLRSFKDTKQSSENTDLGDKEYSYEDVLYLIDKHTKIRSSFKPMAKKQFWRMFMLDAILANRDRHHGNWGYLNTPNGYELAPTYDNGACLFPDVSNVINEYMIDRHKFLYERAEKYPASLLKVYSEQEKRYKRTNYYEVIGEFKLPEMLEVLQEFQAIPYATIKTAIQGAVSSALIPQVYKQFYVDIVLVRYLHIIQRLSIEDAIRRVTSVT